MAQRRPVETEVPQCMTKGPRALTAVQQMAVGGEAPYGLSKSVLGIRALLIAFLTLKRHLYYL
jgi:hypothetical protein